ncbi:MAG: FtsX-like permease family protein, partial [Clostridia bacterium]|nr:FtsX-like permease family protein [Clostridia bacterium]
EEAYPDLVEGEAELWDGYYELIDGEAEYADGLKQYEEGRAQFDAEYEKQLAAMEQGKAQIDAEFKKIEDYYADKAGIEKQIEDCKAEIDRLDSLQEGDEGYDTKTKAIAAAQGEKAALEQYLSALVANEATIEAGRVQLEENLAAYNAAMAQLDAAKAEMDKAKAQLDDARKELNKGWREYYEGKQELEDGWNEYFEGMEELPKARKKLNDGEEEYQEGLTDLEEAKIEAAEEIADAKDELADARREVAEIEECEWYILPRGYNPGYTGFGQDAERMANLATVFPVIFFLVAGLVCLTTMTRMVEEHRTEIGLMKALGYGRWTISAKYLSYGLLPSLAGGLVGLVIGHTLFPAMIYISYQIMYEMPNITLRVYPALSIMSVLAAVACTTVSTLWACLSTLEDSPANLMRPRAPKPGKRVLLERIAPLWKRMSFNWKITTRNLFRYQKRFWMTVIGIGGCTALVIAGVGLRDSLNMSMEVQYGELFSYDAQITYAEGILNDERIEVEQYISASDEIKDHAEIHAASVTAKSDTYSISAYLEAFDAEDIAMFINLRDYNTKESIPLPENGVLIDIKLAELLSLNVGDSFVVDSDGMHEAVVAGIYENYVGHFIYLTHGAYEDIFAEQPEMNGIMLNLVDGSRETCERVTTELLALNGVSAATRAADARDTYNKSMERVDFVVVVIIICAAALAIVVLYNLSNINMTERMRELATIKVLGFYDGEVSAYVYRENIVLTIVGVALGCLIGKYLHGWMIRSVEIDVMMFGREVTTGCYVISAGLTALFSVIVNVMAHRQMKGIDMVESLKSAE